MQEYFQDQLNLPISVGSIYNFNQQAFALLEQFERKLIDHLVASPLLHTDETSINIDGKLHWLHCHSNARWTLFYTHARRGTEAMNEKGVLLRFKGVLCHDHWKPYYKYTGCEHALCNAHHLRELERAYEQDGQQWAKQFQELLNSILTDVLQQGGSLSAEQQNIILNATGSYSDRPKSNVRHRMKRKIPISADYLNAAKPGILLERLQLYQQDVVRFMTNPIVPFTNNQGDNVTCA